MIEWDELTDVKSITAEGNPRNPNFVWSEGAVNHSFHSTHSIPKKFNKLNFFFISFPFIHEWKKWNWKSIITVRLLERKFNQTRRKLMKLIFGAVIEWSESNGRAQQQHFFSFLSALWEWAERRKEVCWGQPAPLRIEMNGMKNNEAKAAAPQSTINPIKTKKV